MAGLIERSIPLRVRLHEMDRELPDGSLVAAHRVPWRAVVWLYPLVAGAWLTARGACLPILPVSLN